MCSSILVSKGSIVFILVGVIFCRLCSPLAPELRPMPDSRHKQQQQQQRSLQRIVRAGRSSTGWVTTHIIQFDSNLLFNQPAKSHSDRDLILRERSERVGVSIAPETNRLTSPPTRHPVNTGWSQRQTSEEVRGVAMEPTTAASSFIYSYHRHATAAMVQPVTNKGGLCQICAFIDVC